MTHAEELVRRIEKRQAACAVIGLGYVGLPLALELAKAGFSVLGIDLSSEKVSSIKAGKSYIPDVPGTELASVVRAKRLSATSDYSAIRRCDTVNICVPTPLNKTRDPDVSYILSAVEGIKSHIHAGMLIILESTTYPGTTEEIVVPALTGPRMRVGKEVFVAFSPERVDPGNPFYRTGNIPKVVGGVTPACTRAAVALYRKVVEQVHAVGTTRVAEMVKLLENTYRSVNIGLVNELALMCDRMGIDVWEVIEGASTKPFGFMPFYPGPGLGGHCIPIDPFYLSWKARSVGFEARFIELAGQVNSYMPVHVVNKATDALNDAGKSLKGAKILILGVTYKKNIDDVRESPALDIIEHLARKRAKISYADPYVTRLHLGGMDLAATTLTPKSLASSDLVIIVTDHAAFDYGLVARHAPLILDTRNALKGRVGRKIWRI